MHCKCTVIKDDCVLTPYSASAFLRSLSAILVCSLAAANCIVEATFILCSFSVSATTSLLPSPVLSNDAMMASCPSACTAAIEAASSSDATFATSAVFSAATLSTSFDFAVSCRWSSAVAAVAASEANPPSAPPGVIGPGVDGPEQVQRSAVTSACKYAQQNDVSVIDVGLVNLIDVGLVNLTNGIDNVKNQFALLG